MRAARSNPGFDMFASKLINALDTSLLDGAGDVYHMSGLAWRHGHGRPPPEAGDVEREVFSPCAAAALYRRSALLKVGGFDEAYFCYVEDTDLGFRLRLAGHRCLYVPTSAAHHIGTATSGGRRSDFSVYHGHRNLVWSFVKNMPGALFWLLLPMHLLLNLVEMAVVASRGQGRVILRAKKDAVLGLPRVWQSRRQIQAARVASLRDIWRALNKQPFPIRR
jgi:GT2 family glycosyltransferase